VIPIPCNKSLGIAGAEEETDEKHERWLEKIANTLATNGPAFVALERAGWALALVTMRRRHEFPTFLEERDRGELTADQLAQLKKLGLM
jgi:hypothetical protein